MFLKNHAKSKVFQNTPSTTPFLNIFFSNLSKILIFSDHVPLELSTKPLHLPPGSSAGFTPRARSASLMGLVDGTEYQKCP